jgi:murein DD-endopeptidase MepM/ murein hydrolase activator NlpD/beta-lactamase regulating signal transducer with metallopeptidase domain
MSLTIELILASLVWGGMIVGAAMALQRQGDLSGSTRQWIWRGAAALLIAPWLAMPIVSWLGLGLAAPLATALPASTGFEGEATTVATLTAAPVSQMPAIDWEGALVAVILAGWIVRFVAAQLAARRLGGLLATSRKAEPGIASLALEGWTQRLALRRKPELRIIESGLSPFSFGAMKAVICLPHELAAQLDGRAIDLVVGHECVHVARGDGWTRPLERVVADVLWFNPFAWIVRHQLDLARELACDERVVELSASRRAYARTLRDVAGLSIGLARSTPAAAMSLAGGGRAMLMRVSRTLDSARRRPARTVVVGAVMVGLAGGCAAFGQAMLTTPKSPPPIPPISQIADQPAPPAPAEIPEPPSPTRMTTGTDGVLRAMFASRVISTGGSASSGYRVELLQVAKGGDDEICHARAKGLKELNVSKGQNIAAGEPIGRTGGSRLSISVTCSDEISSKGFPVSSGTPIPAPPAIPEIADSPAPPAPPAPVIGPAPAPAPAPPAPPAPVAPVKLLGAPKAILIGPAHRSSGFGERTDPFTDKKAFHQGVDFAAAAGTPIHSPGAATVIFAGDKDKLGKVVELSLSGENAIRFAHLQDINVAKGASVKAGDTVGTVGTDANSTGPHVHIEVYQQGKLVDPEEVDGLILLSQN